MKNTTVKVGIIGLGRMGRFYFREMLKSKKWEIASIFDINPQACNWAKAMSPTSKIVSSEDEIFNDPSIQAVGLFTLANLRKDQIKKAVKTGKHIIAEKPVADNMDDEWAVVDSLKDASPILSTVNLYLRNSWYHNTIKKFIAEGEIGELAIIRACHMTPGLAPGEGHEYEGPSFHDCGMHYVDIARWYAESEYKTWHAQALRMWSYKDPWWLQCHGTFENNVVFDITQGFVYGQLSKDQTHNSYIDIIGTKGIARMTHDFKTAVVELHGVTKTQRIEKPYGEKNIDVLCDIFADSIITGKRHPNLPEVRDSVIASQYAWEFLNDAQKHDLPAIGSLETLDEIRERRREMKNGYGLINRSELKSLSN